MNRESPYIFRSLWRTGAPPKSISLTIDRVRKLFRKTAMLTVLVLVSGIGSLETARAEWVEWIAFGQFDFFHNDNINNSATLFDEALSDNVWAGLGSVGRVYQINDSTRLLATFDAGGQLHNEYTKLNNSTIGGTLSIRHKFGLGSQQFWIRSGFSFKNIFSRSIIRDGQLYTGDFNLGKRVHERVQLQFGYAYDARKGFDAEPIREWNGQPTGLTGNVYDHQGHRFKTRADLMISNTALLIIDYSIRRGDVTSTCTPVSFTEALDAGIVTAATGDDAFGGCAYRVDATANSVGIDFNQAFLSGHASFNVGYEFVRGSGDMDYVYRNNIFRVNLMFNY